MASAQSDRKPHRGDLIEIFRGLYQHWAVYIGRGYVVHLAAPSEVPGAGANSMMSVLSVNAMVKKEKLQDVVGTDRWQINNSLDVKYKPRPVDDIVREACALVGQERLYRIFRGNCEHFANEMRYGKAESRQVQKAVEVVLGPVLGPVLSPGPVALAQDLFGSIIKQKNTQ